MGIVRKGRHFPHIAASVNIEVSAQIIGDVFVGRKAQLKAGSIIDGRKGRIKIGKHCLIGESVKIAFPENVIFSEGSLIIEDNVKIGKNSNILGSIGEGSILGENVQVEAGVKVGKNCNISDSQTIKQNIANNSKI